MDYDEENIEIMKDLLEGKDKREPIQLVSVDKTINLRPLTSDELLELQIAEKQGQKGMLKIAQKVGKEKDPKKRKQKIKDQVQNMEHELDYGLMLKNQNKVKRLAISLSAGMPEEDVGKLPSTVLEEIFERVIEISQINENDLDMLIIFREDDEGEDDD